MSENQVLEKRNRELAILNSIARELNATINLGETLDRALSQTIQLLNLKTGWIYLVDSESGEPELAASINLPPGLAEDPDAMKGWCRCLKRYVKGELREADNIDVVNCSRLSKLVKGKNGLNYHSSIPLYTREGSKLGVLNIASESWRRLEPGDLRILTTMADFISVAVERSMLFEELQRSKQRQIDSMERELQIAHDMQMALLPDRPPDIPGAKISGICVPSSHVGGDYYNFLKLNGNKTAIVLSDVSGKGMQAATVAMRFNEMLLYEAEDLVDPVRILKGLDRSLVGRIPPEMFITAGIAVLDHSDMSLHIASAANPEIYYYCSGDKNVRPLGITGFPLGMFEEIVASEPFKSGKLHLGKGDAVVFTSDGVEEARNTEGEFFGGERLAEIFSKSCEEGLDADRIRDRIIEVLKDFMGKSVQTDDITIIVLRSDSL